MRKTIITALILLFAAAAALSITSAVYAEENAEVVAENWNGMRWTLISTDMVEYDKKAGALFFAVLIEPVTPEGQKELDDTCGVRNVVSAVHVIGMDMQKWTWSTLGLSVHYKKSSGELGEKQSGPVDWGKVPSGSVIEKCLRCAMKYAKPI